MTDELQPIRDALFFNEADYRNMIKRQDTIIKALEAEVANLRHRIKALGLEVSARGAATEQMRELIGDID